MSGAYGSSHWLYDADVYQTGQSLKFNDDDSSFLSRTPTTAGNRDKWTWSAWVKLSTIQSQFLFSAYSASSDAGFFGIAFISTGAIRVQGWNTVYRQTNALFRDSAAWYNILLSVDTANGTADDRIKLFVNGSQITSFATNNSYTQNDDTQINNTSLHYIGRYHSGEYFDGYMADVHFIDGQALDPTSFIKTENNQLKPKEYFGTYGTNGFRLNFQDDVISEGFNTVTYTGNGSTQSISGLGFECSGLVWIKDRADTYSHNLFDVCRGPQLNVYSNLTNAEYSDAQTLKSFDGDGFTVGTSTNVNTAADTYVAWCWEAGGTPTANNSANAGATPTAGSVKIDGSNLGSALAGSIAATRLSANTVRGFSIGTFTKGSGTETVAHGLGAAPDWLAVKRTNGTGSWFIYHSANTANPETDYLRFNSSDATADDATVWGDTAPTSSVFSVSTAFNSGEELLFYAWTEIASYSKFSSYTGNGSASGPSETLGFSPAYLMIKRTDGANNWVILDTTRDPDGQLTKYLVADHDQVESDNAQVTTQVDADGFTIKSAFDIVNANGGTYIYMAFADTREAAFFRDVSGNNNNFTPNNLDYRDSMIDTPLTNFCVLNPLTTTAGTYSEGNTRYLGASAWRRTNATYGVSSGKWYWEYCVLSAPYSSRAVNSAYNAGGFGLATAFNSTTAHSSVTDGVVYTDSGYFKNFSGSYTSGSAGAITSVGDIIGFAVNLDDNTFTIYKNNSSEASGTIGMTAGTEITPLLLSYNADYGKLAVNFGQDSSFSGAKIPQGNGADGEDFFYTPPTGFKSLQLSNLPDPAIADPTTQFNIVLYTGNGSAGHAITDSSQTFSADFIWIKNRSEAYYHNLANTVLGITRSLSSNANDAEVNYSNISAVSSSGFTVGGNELVNKNSNAFVAWTWLAGGSTPSQTYTVKVVSDSGNKYRFDDFGTSAITLDLQEGGTYTFDQSDSSNSGHPFRFSTTANGTHGGGSEYTVGVTTNGTAGSAGAYTRITVAASAPTLYYYCTVHSGMGGQANTNSTFGSTNVKGTIQSTVSANTSAGVSIISYTGTGSAATIGHQLNSAPSMVIIKNRDATDAWRIYHASVSTSNNKYLVFGTNALISGGSDKWNGQPTSTVFGVAGDGSVNRSNEKYIMYAFQSVEQFSKVGSYVGNANADGPFIHTNFKVSWLMLKATSGTEDWSIIDAERSPSNVTAIRLYPNSTSADVTGADLIDFLSNGFKLRATWGSINGNGVTFIYMAFASNPFKTTSAR